MVTSISIEWINFGLIGLNEISKSSISIYKNKKNIKYKKYVVGNNLILEKTKKLDSFSVDRFFYIINAIFPRLIQSENEVFDLCDGFEWIIKIHYDSNKVYKLVGNINYPIFGYTIEKEIKALCDECNISPEKIFGCYKTKSQLISDFCDVWINIFTETPDYSDYLFEEIFGNECKALCFVMDCGSSFEEKYSNGESLYNPDALIKIIESVDDYQLLGNAIFSKWRGITHWSYESGFTDENKAWFLMSFKQLKKIVTE